MRTVLIVSEVHNGYETITADWINRSVLSGSLTIKHPY